MKQNSGISRISLFALTFILTLSPLAHAQHWIQKPLILGASVSADYLAPSPGRILARRYGTESLLKLATIPGAPSQMILSTLTSHHLQDVTSIIALDLYFWDSILTNQTCTQSAGSIAGTLAQFAAQGIPIVLGTIPELTSPYLPSGSQTCRSTLNMTLKATCDESQGCLLLDLDDIYRQLQSVGSLERYGHAYTLPELLPDGLHPNSVASEYIADELEYRLDPRTDLPILIRTNNSLKPQSSSTRCEIYADRIDRITLQNGISQTQTTSFLFDSSLLTKLSVAEKSVRLETSNPASSLQNSWYGGYQPRFAVTLKEESSPNLIYNSSVEAGELIQFIDKNCGIF